MLKRMSINKEIKMKWLFLILLAGCCSCPELDYRGWARVDNPFYKEAVNDSVWIYVESGDVWVGQWDSTWYRFRVSPVWVDTINKIKE